MREARTGVGVAIKGLLMLALLGGALAGPARAAEKPLTSDDVLLMLLAGASTDKMLTLIEKRGIDFRMNPDLAKKFHDAGADDMVIEALQKATVKDQAASPSVASAPPVAAPQPPAPTPPASTPQAPAAVNTGIISSQPSDDEHPLAPSFSLVDLSGQKVSLADLRGQVVVVNFWATWCPRCRAAIPRLVELQDKYRKAGLRVIGLSIDGNSKAVKQYFQMQVVNYPVAMADYKTRTSFGGISGVPTTFLIGRDGRIYFTRIGTPQGPGLASYLEPEIKSLLNPPAGGDTTVLSASVSTEASPVPASSGTLEAPTTAAEPSPKPKGVPLPDPGPTDIQRIIQEFAAKEKVFKEARNNYTYHQLNKLNQLDSEGNVVGVFQQEWDILFEDSGKRIERVTYAPPDTLKGLIVTKEDLDNMRNIQPFVLTTEELPDYDVRYLGHVHVDEITAYVFSVRPKEIKKGRLYFQGTVWVDDRDLQIVKSEGKTVPEIKTGKGENLFPRFTTYREQIDGKFWFPTYTIANDTLYFASGAIPIKQIIRYTDYKQFKSKTRILSTEAADTPSKPTATAPKK
jgi:thiol-disulfide isomerase/thioredoxin